MWKFQLTLFFHDLFLKFFKLECSSAGRNFYFSSMIISDLSFNLQYDLLSTLYLKVPMIAGSFIDR